MNSGLFYLLWREPFGRLRRLGERALTLRGFLISIGVLAFVAAVVVPRMLAPPLVDAADSERFAALATWGPYALLLPIATFGLSAGAIFFRPAEVDFLFPAPIGRKQLLLFNILTRWRVQVISGLFAALFVVKWSRHWYGAVIGMVLFLLFLQVLAQLSGLFFATLHARTAQRLRRILPVVVIGGIVALVLSVRALLPSVLPSDERVIVVALRQVIALPAIQPLGALTRPFVDVFLADGLWQLAATAALAAGWIAVAVAAIFAADVAYSESALATTRTLQQRMTRLRGGVSGSAGDRQTTPRFSLPELPRLGGAGPIAWKQFTEMIRNPRALIGFGIMITMWVVLFASMGHGGGSAQDEWLAKALIPQVIFLSVMMNLPFDFRRDTDRLSYFKSLPMSSFGVSAGQIIPSALLLTAVHCGILLIVPAFIGGIDPVVYLYLPALALLNWNAVAVDNALFLWMPYRMAPKDPGQFQFMGKTMFVMFIKMLLLGLVGALAALVIAVLIVTFGIPHAISSAITCLILAASGFALTHLTAGLFDRIDIANDLPA